VSEPEPDARPPRDIPPDDWAVIRSVGSLRLRGGRAWRWDGHDWHRVAGPNLAIPVED
jgi:hypothetical protein